MDVPTFSHHDGESRNVVSHGHKPLVSKTQNLQ